MRLRIGSVNKAASLACPLIRGGEPAWAELPDGDAVAAQELCDAMGEQRYASYSDGTLKLVCAYVRDGAEASVLLEFAVSDGSAELIGSSELGSIALPPRCVDMRKSPRRRH